MFCNFYWLFLGWKTSHKGVNAITTEATPLSVLASAGTISLSLDGTELPLWKRRISHLCCQPPQFNSGNSLLPHDAGGWQLLGFVLSLPAALPDPGSSTRPGWHRSISGHSATPRGGQSKTRGGQHPGPCKGWKLQFMKGGKGKNWLFLWVQTWWSLGKGSVEQRAVPACWGNNNTPGHECCRR